MTGTDYPFVLAWGKVMHSGRGYIQDQVQRARQDKAPKDAIYWERDEDGNRRWVRYSEVTLLSTRAEMDSHLRELGVTPPGPNPAAMLKAARRNLEAAERDLVIAKDEVRRWEDALNATPTRR